MARTAILTWRSTAALSALLSAAGALAAWRCLGAPALGIDDADITLVYARNIAAGNGYVYTTGFERVEGSTSPLWTLLVSLIVRVFGPQPDLAIMLLAWALCAGSLWCVLSTAKVWVEAVGCTHRSVLLALAAVVAWCVNLPDFYAWNTLTLMDCTLWTFSVQLFVYALVCCVVRAEARDLRLAVAAGVVLAFTRPEAMAVGPSLLALAVLAQAGTLGGRASLRRCLPIALAFVLALAVLVLGRLAYFGFPYPNTYYAKMDASGLHRVVAGLGYLKWYLAWRPWTVPFVAFDALALAVMGMKCARRRELDAGERAMLVVTGTVALGLLLPASVGGDHFGSFRLYQPFAPLVALPLLIAGAERRWALPSWALPALALAQAVLSPWVWHRYRSTNELAGDFALSRAGRRAGSVLREAWSGAEGLTSPRPRACVGESWPSVAVVAAGGVALTYPGRILDLVGLNWVAMAHSERLPGGPRGHLAFNPSVFWDARPNMVVLIILDATEHPPHSESDLRSAFVDQVLRGLLGTARFREAYEPAYVATPAGYVGGYFSRSFAPACRPSGYVPLAWR